MIKPELHDRWRLTPSAIALHKLLKPNPNAPVNDWGIPCFEPVDNTLLNIENGDPLVDLGLITLNGNEVRLTDKGRSRLFCGLSAWQQKINKNIGGKDGNS